MTTHTLWVHLGGMQTSPHQQGVTWQYSSTALFSTLLHNQAVPTCTNGMATRPYSGATRPYKPHNLWHTGVESYQYPKCAAVGDSSDRAVLHASEGPTALPAGAHPPQPPCGTLLRPPKVCGSVLSLPLAHWVEQQQCTAYAPSQAAPKWQWGVPAATATMCIVLSFQSCEKAPGVYLDP